MGTFIAIIVSLALIVWAHSVSLVFGIIVVACYLLFPTVMIGVYLKKQYLENKKSKVVLYGGGFLALFPIAAIWSGFSSDLAHQKAMLEVNTIQANDALTTCCAKVGQYIDHGLVARFNPDHSFVNLGYHNYIIQSVVNVSDVFGSEDNLVFYCQMKYLGGGKTNLYNWTYPVVKLAGVNVH